MVVYCTRCGTEARDDDAFCVRCGRPIVGPPFVAAAAGVVGWPAEAATPPREPALGASSAPPSGVPSRPASVAAGVASDGTRALRLGETTYQLATFGRRLAGTLVDVLVVTFLGLLVGFAVGIGVAIGEVRQRGDLSDAELQQRMEARIEEPAIANAIGIAGGMVGAVYVLAGHMLGVTLGKKAVGVRVLRADGRRPGVLRGLARWAASWLSAVALWLGYVWVLWDDNRQTWHDKLAGTYVVRR